MSSKNKSKTTAASEKPDHIKSGKTKEKSKDKAKDCTREKVGSEMGCGPSQAVVIQSSSNRNAHLQPTIFMVGEQSFQLLRELGELKFYQLAQYNETEEIENLHRDIAARLENPVAYLTKEESCTTSPREEDRIQSNNPLEHKINLETNRRHHLQQENTIETSSYSGNSIPVTSPCSADIPSSSNTEISVSRNGKGKCRTESGIKILEDPQTLPGRSADAKNVAATKPSGIQTVLFQESTLETRTKSKTFFGRNRIGPEQCHTATQYSPQPSQSDIREQSTAEQMDKT